MQKKMRERRKEGISTRSLGYTIYQLNGNLPVGSLDKNTLQKLEIVAHTPTFVSMREIFGRHKLPPGEYLIIPCTFNKDEDSEFLLRLYSEKPGKAEYVYS